MRSFGNIMVEPQANRDSFGALIKALDLKPPVLIKPNWGTVECYTEAEILDWTLAAIPGEKLVIESHGWARDESALTQQKPAELTKVRLRQGDRWFLDYTGIRDVLEKHQVEYLNLTEEIWAGRCADPEQIKQKTEASYAPVQLEELYGLVPERLFALRGGTLLSLAKCKMVFYPLGVSLAIKNLFGLIPSPSRGKFHGKEHACLDQSIVDIHKIYRSLFSMAGVVDAVHSVGVLETDSERTRVYPGSGATFASRDPLAVDACVTAIAGRAPESVGHLRLTAQTFGLWDAQAVEQAVRSGVKVMEPALKIAEETY
jgi:uncharacterized protein (DUF362 family)